jgi:hypothetical protein
MKTFVGIDVAKAHVDLYDTITKTHLQFENHPEGIIQCTNYLRRENCLSSHPERSRRGLKDTIDFVNKPGSETGTDRGGALPSQ